MINFKYMLIVSKQDLEEIKKMKGQIIGSSLKTDREFILERKGKGGLEKVEREMAKLGYPLKYEEIENYQWYPVQLDPLFLSVSQRTFNWDDKVMWEWGRWGAKTHFIVKLMIRYFISKEIIAKSANKFWRKYYTRGTLDFKLSKKENSGIVTIRDFITCPAQYRYLEGYFFQIMSLVVPPEKLKVEQVEALEENSLRFKTTW